MDLLSLDSFASSIRGIGKGYAMNIAKILSESYDEGFSAAFNKMIRRDRDHVAIGFFCIEDFVPWSMLEVAAKTVVTLPALKREPLT